MTNMKNALNKKGLTKRNICSLLGEPLSKINAILDGMEEPTAEQKELLCKVLDIGGGKPSYDFSLMDFQKHQGGKVTIFWEGKDPSKVEILAENNLFIWCRDEKGNEVLLGKNAISGIGSGRLLQ